MGSKPFYTLPLPVAEYDDRPDGVRQAGIYRELLGVCIQKRYSLGWAAWTYRQMFGEWPGEWMKTLNPMTASPTVEKWIRSKNNAYKKRMREKDAANGRTALFRGAAAITRSRRRNGGDGAVEGGLDEPSVEGDGGAEGDGTIDG